MQGYSFGDIRLDRRGDVITEQIVATGSLVLRRFGGRRSGELAAARFLASTKVTPEAILDIHAARTAAAAQGRRIVAIQDTTEVNFSGRDRGRKGLGPGGDGKAKGFFIHAAVAVDPDSETLLGVLDAQIWTRPQEGTGKRRQTTAVEEKETMRWITAMKACPPASRCGLQPSASISLTGKAISIRLLRPRAGRRRRGDPGAPQPQDAGRRHAVRTGRRLAKPRRGNRDRGAAARPRRQAAQGPRCAARQPRQARASPRAKVATPDPGRDRDRSRRGARDRSAGGRQGRALAALDDAADGHARRRRRRWCGSIACAGASSRCSAP